MFLAILVIFLSHLFQQFSPRSTEQFQHLCKAIFGAKRRKFTNSLKTIGKFIKNTSFLAILFSNFRREAAIFLAIVFQQFWPRSGEKKFSILFSNFSKFFIFQQFFKSFKKTLPAGTHIPRGDSPGRTDWSSDRSELHF